MLIWMRSDQGFRHSVICMLLAVSWTTEAVSQIDSSTVSNPIIRAVGLVAGDMKHLSSEAVRISKKDALQLLSFSLLNAGLIYRGDASADEEFAVEGHQVYLKPAKALADIGYLYDDIGTREMFGGSALAFLIGGMIFRNDKMLHTSRLIVESSIVTGAITYWGKGLFGRARPFTGEGPHEFDLFEFRRKTAYRALPSGHTSSAFAIMTVIAKQYPQWWIKYPAYSIAAGVALQRMDDRKHWTSDVIVGGAIGYWISKTLTDHYQQRETSIQMMPYLSLNRIGLRILLD